MDFRDENQKYQAGSTAFDVAEYFWDRDPWPGNDPTVDWRRLYQEKHRLAVLLQPQSVAEIGVRAGYSAAAFLAAGAAGAMSYTGFDRGDTGGWGGTPGALAHARRMLPERFPGAAVAITECDTQKVAELSARDVDLFHVDGDHSRDGCLRDLELALACRPRWILVDDCTHHADTVGRAVAAFLQRHALPHVMLDTVRGDCLMQVCPATGKRRRIEG
jgi:hypothetical protein